jgi:hypothetical protein
MKSYRKRRRLSVMLALTGLFSALGCQNSRVDVSTYSRGPAPLRTPGGEPSPEECSYEESLQGHHVFELYCASCHNARPLSERPFSNYFNVAQHMRVRANLTGAEYAKLTAWLRRWHDVPAPEQREPASPKRFFFSQQIPELREQASQAASGPTAGPRSGMNDESSPGQPQPGNSPQEAR